MLLEAWGDLTGDRLTDGGQIPFVAIDRWASRHGVDDPDDFDDLLRGIRAMDGVYLDYLHERASAGTK